MMSRLDFTNHMDHESASRLAYILGGGGGHGHVIFTVFVVSPENNMTVNKYANWNKLRKVSEITHDCTNKWDYLFYYKNLLVCMYVGESGVNCLRTD